MPSEDTLTGADISLKIAGQEVSVKNVRSLNTIATVASLIMISALIVMIYYHEASAESNKSSVAKSLTESNAAVATTLKETSAAMTSAIKELTLEQRRSTNAIQEVACLNDPAMRNRVDAREFCKRIVRRAE